MRQSRRRGFTLIEVLLAVAMVSMVLTLAYGSFSTATRVAEEREASARALHRADFVLRHLSDHVQNIYLDQVAYYRMDDPAALFAGSAESLTFWTQSPPQTRRASERGGLQQVVYRVESPDGPRSDAAAAADLVHEAFPELQTDADEPAARWALPVEAVEFEYFDGHGWNPDWDVATEERLPRGLRVTVRLLDGRGVPLEVQTIIPVAVTGPTLLDAEDERGVRGGLSSGGADGLEDQPAGEPADGGDAGAVPENFNPFEGAGSSRRRDPIAEALARGQ